jgi:hypothetical protein
MQIDGAIGLQGAATKLFVPASIEGALSHYGGA